MTPFAACPCPGSPPCFALLSARKPHPGTPPPAQRLTDINHDNQVTRGEWLCAILVLNGVCSRTLLKDILRRFDEMDTDRNGKLSVDDMIRQLASTHDLVETHEAVSVGMEMTGQSPSLKKQDTWTALHENPEIDTHTEDRSIAGAL